MKKSLIFSALTAAGMIAAPSAHAALVGGELLTIDPGELVCIIGGTPPDNCTHGVTNVPTGSYFGMDTSGNGVIENPEKVAIAGTLGLRLDGVAQANGNIDLDWSFAGNLGRHNTTAQGTTPSVNLDGTVDMSGWSVNWGAPGAEVDINMGTGGSAIVQCTSGTNTCAVGETYVLDYSTTVPAGQPFENVFYALHLEGTVSAVPVPAAVWLFGSGLLGLVGVARRRKTA